MVMSVADIHAMSIQNTELRMSVKSSTAAPPTRWTRLGAVLMRERHGRDAPASAIKEVD